MLSAATNAKRSPESGDLELREERHDYGPSPFLIVGSRTVAAAKGQEKGKEDCVSVQGRTRNGLRRLAPSGTT
jgi:hypothetical protein